MPGFTAQDRTANVLVILLVMVEGEVQLRRNECRLCMVVTKKNDVLPGFHRASATLVMEHVMWDLSSAWQGSTSLGLVDLIVFGPDLEPIMSALGKAAKAQQQEIYDHMSSKGVSQKKTVRKRGGASA